MFQTNTITRRAALLLAAAGLLLSGCGSLGLGKSSPPAAPAKPKAVVALALGGGAQARRPAVFYPLRPRQP